MFKPVLLIVAALALLTTSCKKKGCSESSATSQKIQGSWKHDYPEREPDFTQPDQYNFIRFQGDSFFLQVTIHTDIVNVCHPTYTGNYVKGVYEITGGKLLMHGVYTDDNFNVSTGPCEATGPYEQAFYVHFCNADIMLKEVTPKMNWPNYSGPKMVKQ